MSFNWSSYQKAVFDWIENGEGNAIVDAKAGAGKTTTLVEAADRIEGSGLFVAFNKHIQRELDEKLEDTEFICKTIHSCGYGALSYAGHDLTVDSDKYKDIVDEMTEEMSFDTHKKTAKADLRRLISLVRLNLVNPDNLDGIRRVARHHGIATEEVFSLVAPAIKRGTKEAKEHGLIDFDDMIYLPVIWNLNFYRNDWVLVDEAQDLNTCEREVCSRMVKNNGRMIFVGDPNQAIYGFSGADSDSFERIKNEFDCKELPLNITYRCPESHVDHVQRLVPEIEAREDAPEGEIKHGSLSEIGDVVESGDYILCRTNAPLIKNAIRLAKAGTKVNVVGRNIKQRLISIVDQVGFDNFLENLKEYHRERAEKVKENDAGGGKLEMLRDQFLCLQEVYEAFAPDTAYDLKEEIKNLFREDEDAVKLMTVHKAKGLGNERIIIIRPDLMPLEWRGQKDWEYAQEENLIYTAETRSKKELIYLSK